MYLSLPSAKQAWHDKRYAMKAEQKKYVTGIMLRRMNHKICMPQKVKRSRKKI